MNAPRRRSRRSFGLLFALVLGAAAGGAGACSRAHLTNSHGRAYRDVFAAQDANPNRTTVKSVHGLDSQEATIISGSYRRALSPSASPQTQQLLTTSPTAGNATANMPAAQSVP